MLTLIYLSIFNPAQTTVKQTGLKLGSHSDREGMVSSGLISAIFTAPQDQGFIRGSTSPECGIHGIKWSKNLLGLKKRATQTAMDEFNFWLIVKV